MTKKLPLFEDHLQFLKTNQDNYVIQSRRTTKFIKKFKEKQESLNYHDKDVDDMLKYLYDVGDILNYFIDETGLEIQQMRQEKGNALKKLREEYNSCKTQDEIDAIQLKYAVFELKCDIDEHNESFIQTLFDKTAYLSEGFNKIRIDVNTDGYLPTDEDIIEVGTELHDEILEKISKFVSPNIREWLTMQSLNFYNKDGVPVLGMKYSDGFTGNTVYYLISI